MQESILMRQPTDWLTPGVRSVSKGIGDAQNLSFLIQTFALAPDLQTLIRTVELNNEFGLSAIMSFLLVLRVPSETLAMRREADSDCLPQFAPEEQMVLQGILIFQGEPHLLSKFAWWGGGLPRGCILRRPCLCAETSDTERVLRPIHMLWPRMIADIDTRDRLFPSLKASRFNRPLKDATKRA